MSQVFQAVGVVAIAAPLIVAFVAGAAIAELQNKGAVGASSQELISRAQELACRVQALAGIAQTIATLNQAGVTAIDRSVVDEVLSRAQLEGLLS